MKNLSDIRIRDPFILPHDNVYYLYGTIGETNGERSLYVHKSTDLNSWTEPQVIFTLPDASWAVGELWAPEVHKYNGRFYLFVSILGKNGLRGVQIAVSNTPEGLFECVANKPITPSDKSCIDGTLYLENGTPYVVYSHDWPDNYIEEKGVYVGQICALQLNDTLTDSVGDPFLLFDSWDAPVSMYAPVTHEFGGKTVTRYGSDGPFLIKDSGKLLLLWSPIPNGNYIVAYAISESGCIKSEWKHCEKPLFSDNGGHAMVFEDFNGRLTMCIHHPEVYFSERALLQHISVKDTVPALM